MRRNSTIKQQKLNRLAELEVDLINLIDSAVSREVKTDAYLEKDAQKQELLRNFIRGLCIIYYFSFLEANISKKQWDKIKRSKNTTERNKFKNIDWDKFDLFKYVRDCFAHNWNGEMFSESKSNTKNFISILNKRSPNYLSIKDKKIILNQEALHECLLLVYSILEELCFVDKGCS